MLFYGGNARHEKARVASNRSEINRKIPFEMLDALKVLKRLFQHFKSLAGIS